MEQIYFLKKVGNQYEKRKRVYRTVYGKTKPYYFINGKKKYVKNLNLIETLGTMRQIPVSTKNLRARVY